MEIALTISNIILSDSIITKKFILSAFEMLKISHILYVQKKFYNRETTPFIRIFTIVAESPSTLSWLAEILEIRKGLIIWFT